MRTIKYHSLTLLLALSLSSVSAVADIGSRDSVDLDGLKAWSVSGDVNAQLEKIYQGVRDFHIFKPNYARWSGTDTFTTLVTGQNGFPVFSPRSDKDPKYTDYPIDYRTHAISRYRPVRPPESVLNDYTSHNIALGDKATATYHAPLVAAGTLGKGRVLLMGSHLYGSVLVNPRNYSDNVRNNNKTAEPDTADMEQFFHNTFGWLTAQNEQAANRYAQSGAAIKVLSNKEHTMFWGASSAGYQHDAEDFLIHPNYNLIAGENPRYVTSWKEAAAANLLDPSVYPLLILEDFERSNGWTSWQNVTERRTQMDEVALIADYIRAGGGVLMMESPYFLAEHGVVETASNEIMQLAGVTSFFANNNSDVKLLPNKTEVGGVHQYDMCLVDYISHTDLQRRLGMDDYTNVPTTLEELTTLLTARGQLAYLEEVLKRRQRKIFLEGTAENPVLTPADCGLVEITDADGNPMKIQSYWVKGDGIVQDGANYDKYAKYPVDLNFVEAQGDVGGSMNSLLAHERGEQKLTDIDLKREYTNMSALLLNDAVFSGAKFSSLNTLLDQYKPGGDARVVNERGEFYPGFSFSRKEVLDFRHKPVTRIMVERAFYDTSLKYDPSAFPGETSDVTATHSAEIYLRRNTTYQKWYAGNMQSTGLYAPAHTDVTVTLPAHVDATKLQLIIGVGDNVGGIFRHEINLKRPPQYVKKYKFIASDGGATQSITVRHPYGGLIFLRSFDRAASHTATAKVTFSNVQRAVRFVLGQTTASEWQALQTAVAPKAELESKHYIVTVARANMASLSFAEVTALAEQFDQMSQNAYDFYGYDRTCSEPFHAHTPPSCALKPAHKHREVFDPHISVGAGHSGYPIMVMKWQPESATFPQDPTNSFLLWHEMGHNMVEPWLSIPGASEVANNVMALHQQKRFGRALSTASSISGVNAILAQGQPWADGGNAGRLLLFHQLAKWIDRYYLTAFKAKNTKYYEANGAVKAAYPFLDGDGFDVYKIMHREARDSAAEQDKYDSCRKQAGKTRTDMLALCSSTILELNLSGFYTAWKAGVIGIGHVGGETIYDASNGLSAGLDVGYDTLPQPAVQRYVLAD